MNEIQQHIKIIVHCDQAEFILGLQVGSPNKNPLM